MTVRDRTGRVRYVAVRVRPAPQPRGAVAGVLPEGAKLTRFDGEHGLVRVRHTAAAPLVAWMRARQKAPFFEPLRTSGTIRAAARALPAGAPARVRDPRPKA